MNKGQSSEKTKGGIVASGETEAQTGFGRRDFLLAGAAGAAALGAGTSGTTAVAQDRKRVVLLADGQTHMMPALAIEMARRNHNLVISTPAEGLEGELHDLGVEVEVVAAAENINEAGAAQALVEAAIARFGGFDSACIRTGSHLVGDIFAATKDDADQMYSDNLLSVMYALQAVLPPLAEQGSGQVVINTSASGFRPTAAAVLYSATRAAANSLVRAAALNVADKGVSVNATGTYALDYPGFTESLKASAPDDPNVLDKASATLPLGRLGKPEEVAHFTAGLLDGKANFQTGQFFALDGGWSFV